VVAGAGNKLIEDALLFFGACNLTVLRRSATLVVIPMTSVAPTAPRSRADGSPLLNVKDRYIIFESQIGTDKVKVRFDLRKMVCNGKLEI